MNRQLIGMAAGLGLLAGCSSEQASPPEAIPATTTSEQSWASVPLRERPLIEIGGVIVICAGIKGLSETYDQASCDKATKTINSGLRHIADETDGAVRVPPISSVIIPRPLQAEPISYRCETNIFKSSEFTQQVLNAVMAAPETRQALQQKPDHVLHIVSESPVKETCGSTTNRVQARYIRGKERDPIVQFMGEGRDRDAMTAAHERLHRWLGHTVRLTYPNNNDYNGEALDGSERFIEAPGQGPTVMGDGAPPFLYAFQQWQLGVLEPKDIVQPTGTETVTLFSSFNNSAVNGPRLLTLPLKHTGIAQRPLLQGIQERRYWVEQESPEEVAVMVAGESDGTPDQPAVVALLHPGQPRFIDKASGFELVLSDINPTQAVLKVHKLN